MPRLPRSSFPPYGVWHVTTRGVERRRVFLTRDDALWFMTLLGRAVWERELRGLVLCLMPNHYHFVVEGVRGHPSQALHRVNGIYAGRSTRVTAAAGTSGATASRSGTVGTTTTWSRHAVTSSPIRSAPGCASDRRTGSGA